jgi:hypothetical protein
MDIEAIRRLRRAEPFLPFRLEMEDGRDLPVEKSYYQAISPTGRSLTYALPTGGFEFLKPLAVKDAVVDPTIGSERKRSA